MNEKLPDILAKILAHKTAEVAKRKERTAFSALASKISKAGPTRNFFGALEKKLRMGKPGIIAEIKKASPSRGVIRENLDPSEIAIEYEQAGAACLSVLTDKEFFQGDAIHLQQARAASNLPVLCKDFVIDPYQIYEARVMGADCVLLIAAILNDTKLQEYAELAKNLGMDYLVEVHDYTELSRALQFGFPLLGINNRNLRTFETKLDTTLELRQHVPDDRLLVTESAINTREDFIYMRSAGINAFLIGETFMRAPQPGVALQELLKSC